LSEFRNFEKAEGLKEREIRPDGVVREVFSSAKAEISEKTEKYQFAEKPGMIGTPEQDAKSWHRQTEKKSCAVSCQEFVAEGLLGKDFSEERMLEYARQHDLIGESGTSAEHVGVLLERMGLEVTREYGADIRDICQVLSEGGKVMAGVNGVALSSPEYARRPGVAADHMVQVTGVDVSNPQDIRVILNDPGSLEGCARNIPLKTFEQAWKTSDCYMVSAFR